MNKFNLCPEHEWDSWNTSLPCPEPKCPNGAPYDTQTVGAAEYQRMHVAFNDSSGKEIGKFWTWRRIK